MILGQEGWSDVFVVGVSWFDCRLNIVVHVARVARAARAARVVRVVRTVHAACIARVVPSGWAAHHGVLGHVYILCIGSGGFFPSIVGHRLIGFSVSSFSALGVSFALGKKNRLSE